MQFVLADRNEMAVFLYEEEAYSGVKKVADRVREDICLVTGQKPVAISVAENNKVHKNAVIFATAGKSPLLDSLEKNGKIDTSYLYGKEEVYGIWLLESPAENIECALVIAGSDKRGTIYGLFHISELLGISPFVDWSGVLPPKKDAVYFDESITMLSKEPSVKYRGFFLNDEWPAFGTYCEKHYGGMNAKMYENIFLLLLRMKGNYLWPAMWASCFAEEGPGLLNAELADEYGVVMGLSHHEPCLRHGEEYSKLRGKDSPYGDAWNFRTNREGITNFWRDGLRRNGHLENIITLGMRGERDSAIMGREATLGDNIDLIRDVIHTQNKLISEEVCEDITKVPRLLALYKEVEPFFYGDDTYKGLMGDPCLDDVILLLCDDNHGYMRSRPNKEMLEHKGGYGLYYHFDYHGEPVSYEWVNSSYLPQVWEQLTEAYETGIRQLWIVNVGDLAFQEFPLSYFMEMAYDYDTWGIAAKNQTEHFTGKWIEQQFADDFSKEDKECLTNLFIEYTRLNHNRRPEHMNEDIYHPVYQREAEMIYKKAAELTREAERLYVVCKRNKDAFEELIGYQVKASMNYISMCIYRAWNHYAAKRGMVIANDFAKKIVECMEKDEKLTEEFHNRCEGKWDGLAAASHIGFCNWNDEEAKNPIIETVIPIKKTRLAISASDSEEVTSGEEWTRKVLKTGTLTDKREKYALISVALCSDKPVDFEVQCEDERILLSASKGVVSKENPVYIIKASVDEEAWLTSEKSDNPMVYISYANASAQVEILMPDKAFLEKAKLEKGKNCFVENNGIVCIHASSYKSVKEHEGESVFVLNDIAKASDGVKLYADSDLPAKDNPSWLLYEVIVKTDGKYELTLETEPASPRMYCGDIIIGYSVNGQSMKQKSLLPKDYEPGVSRSWEEGVLDHVRRISDEVNLKAGRNEIKVYPLSGENVLERIIVRKTDREILPTYLGLRESIKTEEL